MTRSEAKAAAEVLLAFANGIPIQTRRKSSGASAGWDDVHPSALFLPDFNFVEFRIKPEPEEFFITVYGDAREAVKSGEGNGTDPFDVPCIGATYNTLPSAKVCASPYARIFKLVEVTE